MNHISTLRHQGILSASLLLLAICLAWEIGLRIASQDITAIAYVALCFVGVGVAVTVLRNWRLGFYFFLVWLLFEDLARKYLGNNMAIYFAKDVLVGLVYIAFYLGIRRRDAKIFRPPFLFVGSLLLWLGVAQIFNPNSPHILYGLLGFKVYFYYVPLIFVGYALIRGDEDLRKFLVLNGFLAAIIGGIGIIQAIVGNSFLNPTHLAPELRDLGNLQKITPLTNQIFTLPDSVFVSSGRFSLYLTFAMILTVGTAGYLLLYTKRSRKIIYIVFAIVVTATLLSGSRSAAVSAVTSGLVLLVGFLWGRLGAGGTRIGSPKQSAALSLSDHLVSLFFCSFFRKRLARALRFILKPFRHRVLHTKAHFELGIIPSEIWSWLSQTRTGLLEMGLALRHSGINMSQKRSVGGHSIFRLKKVSEP